MRCSATVTASSEFAINGVNRPESCEVPPTDCPHCAARDTVRLESGDHFCPWCLHAWPNSGGLMLDRSGEGREEYLDDLARAFDPD